MFLVAILAEVLQEYTAVIAGAVEHVLNETRLPISRRIRYLIICRLPYASARAPHRLRLPDSRLTPTSSP